LDLIISILVMLIALEHLAFLILEMFLWTKETGRRIFLNSKEKAELTKILAANQGLYNGFLSAGLIWGLVYPDPIMAKEIMGFFLVCIFVAGVYGGFSVKQSIWLIQALPACVALILLFI